MREDAPQRGARTLSEVSKTERILNLVSYLLKERRPVPWREIAGRVVGYDDGSDARALERRFERDKAALKEMGVRIVYCPPGMYETEGYLIPREACFLDNLQLMPHEAALLNLLSELALRKGGTSFSADLMSALQKLRFDAPRPAVPAPAPATGGAPPAPAGAAAARAPAPGAAARRKRGRPPKRPLRPGSGQAAPAQPPAGPGEGALQASLLDLDLTASLRTDPNVSLLTQALLANQRVRFTYCSARSGERRRREVDPYGIGFSRGAWYVVGFDDLRKEMRQFRLDRIEGAVEPFGAERAFKPPSGFKVTDYIERLPWEMAQVPPTVARVEVGPDIAFFVEDLVAGKAGAAEARPDGSGAAAVRLEVRDRSAFVRWVLAHLRHVRILEPRSLRDELRAAIDEIRRRHER